LICSTQEQGILDNCNVTLTPSSSNFPQRSKFKGSPSLWSPLPEGFIKLNFDGASKGNPGEAGFGVVFHNRKGNILLISVGSMGHTTNNMADLGVLQKVFKSL